MKNVFFIPILLLSFLGFSQLETEILSVNYSNYSNSSYYDKIFSSTTQKMDVAITYGHDLGKKSSLFYYATYQKFNFAKKTDNQYTIYDDLKFYKPIPNYELLTFATGLKNKFKNNWSLTNFITYTFADDFNKGLLNKTQYYRSFSFLSKSKSENLSYGFGIYTSKIGKSLSILPILQFKYFNKKYGAKLFFPRSLQFWQTINTNSYLDLKTDLDLNLLAYAVDNLTVKNTSITSSLNYNYIFNKKIKIKAGLGLPIRLYKYEIDNAEKTTSQVGGLSFNIGMSYVVFTD